MTLTYWILSDLTSKRPQLWGTVQLHHNIFLLWEDDSFINKESSRKLKVSGVMWLLYAAGSPPPQEQFVIFQPSAQYSTLWFILCDFLLYIFKISSKLITSIDFFSILSLSIWLNDRIFCCIPRYLCRLFPFYFMQISKGTNVKSFFFTVVTL